MKEQRITRGHVDRVEDGRMVVVELETPSGLTHVDLPHDAFAPGVQDGDAVTLTIETER